MSAVVQLTVDRDYDCVCWAVYLGDDSLRCNSSSGVAKEQATGYNIHCLRWPAASSRRWIMMMQVNSAMK